MKAIIIFCLIILGLIIALFVISLPYRNPYKLIMVFGKKGSGKSTFITKTAINYIKKGIPVYSTIYVPGARLFDVEDIGKMSFQTDSVIFIDEVGMIWDNRNYKNFRSDVRDWFKLQRHYRNTVYLFSQTFDVDIKLRNLTDAMYLLKNHMGIISVARRIRRNIVIVSPSGDSESRIADNLEFEPLILQLFGAKSIIFTWIPHWVKYFDSFSVPGLPPMLYSFCSSEDQLEPNPDPRLFPPISSDEE